MADPISCRNCQTVNSPDSQFCKQCGSRLLSSNLDPTTDAAIRNEINALVKAKMDQLAEFTTALEGKIELECRKKIDGWFSKGGIVGVIVMGLVGVTAGLKVYSLEETMQQTRNEAEKVKAEAEQTNAEIEKTKNSVFQMRLELESTVASIKNDLGDLEKKKNEVVTQAEATKTRIDEAQRTNANIRKLIEANKDLAADVTLQSKELLASVQRTENATWDIYINYPGKLDNEGFRQALDELRSKGFRADFINVERVEVNLNEIVYFSELNIGKAEEMKELLKPFYKDIQTRFKKIADRSGRFLLLKLKSDSL